MDEIKIMALIIAGILGLCIGSFLNVVIYRVPNGLNIAKPTSHCPNCKNPIKWYDNIPVLSYIFLGGKCRHCKEHISFRYTIVEILNAVLWLLSVLMFWDKSIFFTCTLAVTCSVLLCMVFIDLEQMIIPDVLQIALLICAIVMIFAEWNEQNTWQNKIYGFLLCASFALLIHYVPLVLFKKEALGGGDVKLFAILGLLLGIANSLLAIVIAFVSASLVLVIIKIVKKYNREKEYPFAPFIVMGIMVSLFFGYSLVEGYLSLIS